MSFTDFVIERRVALLDSSPALRMGHFMHARTHYYIPHCVVGMGICLYAFPEAISTHTGRCGIKLLVPAAIDTKGEGGSYVEIRITVQ